MLQSFHRPTAFISTECLESSKVKLTNHCLKQHSLFNQRLRSFRGNVVAVHEVMIGFFKEHHNYRCKSTVVYIKERERDRE